MRRSLTYVVPVAADRSPCLECQQIVVVGCMIIEISVLLLAYSKHGLLMTFIESYAYHGIYYN